MTFGHHLETWLADRQRQCRTQAGIDGFARDWHAGEVKQRISAAIAALPAPDAEALAAAARALFADDSWVDAAISELAGQLRDDPFFEPPFRAINSDIHTGLALFEDPRLSIAVGVTRAVDLAAKKNAKRGPTSIGFSGRVSVLKFVKAGETRLSFWEAPRIDAGFSARSAGQCARTGERRLADGDILTVDGRQQGYVIEHARANLLVLHAEISADAAPLSVEYDSATLAYVGCSATGDGASRIQMLATLLRKLGRDAAFPTLVGFLDHPDFFVRWHVMRELLGMDAEAARPHLKRMAARDPHEDVRRAARTVLDRLEAPKARKAA
ncbi:MAG: HEAT repeat domain-containing protein [Alphaproteobacteria bacterium]|nr:HEAT repeat domain-containing protein [Alphaproteobacteria bacterium]